MKLKEYFLKDCQSLLTVVKKNLKLMNPVLQPLSFTEMFQAMKQSHHSNTETL
jgi:hypothetical protein